MKRVPFFYYIMACLLSICITACDKEEQLIEDEIPEMIKADLSKRYPSVEILNYQEYSNFSQINVIDLKSATIIQYTIKGRFMNR